MNQSFAHLQIHQLLNMPADSKTYRESFRLEPKNELVIAEALKHALDIRKFEIGLYWQRATYFWTLIAAAFAGYFAVLSAEKLPNKEFNAFVIACIGFVFSLAWFLVNRGSKFWQENWENHVDMLEDEVVGPLYKTILRRPSPEGFVEKWVDGPLPISVSKVNQWVSLFTILIWILLGYNVLPPFDCKAAVSVKHLITGGLTFLVLLALVFLTKTHLGNHRHIVMRRTTSVKE